MLLVQKVAFMILLGGSIGNAMWCQSMIKHIAPVGSASAISERQVPETTALKIGNALVASMQEGESLSDEPSLQLIGVISVAGSAGVGLVRGDSLRPIVLPLGATYQEKWKVTSLDRKSLTLVRNDQVATGIGQKDVMTCCDEKTMTSQAVGGGK